MTQSKIDAVQVMKDFNYAFVVQQYPDIICTKCGIVAATEFERPLLTKENTVNYNPNAVYFNGELMATNDTHIAKCPKCLEANFTSKTQSNFAYVSIKDDEKTLEVEMLIAMNYLNYNNPENNRLKSTSNVIAIRLDKVTKGVYLKEIYQYHVRDEILVNILVDGSTKDTALTYLGMLPEFVGKMFWANLMEEVSPQTINEWSIQEGLGGVNHNAALSKLLFMAYLPFAASFPKEFNFSTFNINQETSKKLIAATDELSFYRGIVPALSKQSKNVFKQLIQSGDKVNHSRVVDSFFLSMVERPEALSKILVALQEKNYEVLIRTNVYQTGAFEEDDLTEDDPYMVSMDEAKAYMNQFLRPGSIDNYIHHAYKQTEDTTVFINKLFQYFELIRDAVNLLRKIEIGKKEISAELSRYREINYEGDNPSYALFVKQEEQLIKFYENEKGYGSVKELHDNAGRLFNGMVTRWENYYIDDKDETLEATVNDFEFKWVRDTTQLCSIGAEMDLCVASYYEEISDCNVGILGVYLDGKPVLCIEFDTAYRNFSQIKKYNNQLLNEDNAKDHALIESLVIYSKNTGIIFETRDLADVKSMHPFVDPRLISQIA